MRRLVLVLVLTAAVLVAPSLPHAKACSCAPSDVRERLPESAAGAFVGTLVSRDDPQPAGGGLSSATLVRYRYHVERAVKGAIPSGGAIDVWSSWSGASCGLETAAGQRAGLLLRQEDGRWLSSLCEQADPDVLIRAGQPLPPPRGRAPPAVLVGTTHGPGRMVSLDGLGRVVAYGGGDGIATDIAICPGGDRLAEAYTPPSGPSSDGPGVAVRTSDGLDVVWERLVGADGGPGDTSVADVACLGRDGGTVLALAVRHVYSETPARHRALVLAFGRQGEPDVLWQGEATTGTFSPDGRAAYLNGGADGRDLLLVELANPAGPATRTLGRLPAGTGALAIAPDGRHLAGVTTHEYWSGIDPPPSPTAVMVDTSTSPAGVTEAGLGASYAQYGTALWVSPERVLVAPRWGGQPVRLFDAALRETGRWDGWAATAATVVGDTLVGLDGPKVVTAPVASGPPTTWADLESGLPGAVAAFPGGAAIGSAGSPTTTTAPATGTTAGGKAPAPTTSPPGATEEATSTTSPPPTAPDGAAGGNVVALPAPSGGGGTSGRPLLAGGAGAALLAAGLAGLIRRRRARTLP